MMKLSQALQRVFDRFLFESCSVETCVVLRVTYALLLIPYTLVWWKDGTQWFSDAGVMSSETANAVLEGPQWSLFFAVPAEPWLVQTCLAVLLLHSVCLLLGVFSRFQAACIFFWLLSFQHRNPLVCDGEDTVFRLLAFFMIFMPLDAGWSLGRRWLQRFHLDNAQNAPTPSREHAWAIRLVQVQMSLIYISAAWCKFRGESWQDGSAIFYVFQMQDLFGRGPLPEMITQSEPLIRVSTWAVVAVEGFLPLLLWLRPTRRWGVLLGIGLHLTIEYSMHLFLFQWIMIVGLLAFVDFSNWRWLRITPDANSMSAPQQSAPQLDRIPAPIGATANVAVLNQLP